MPPLDRRRASSEFCLVLERDDVIAEAGIGPKCSDGRVRNDVQELQGRKKIQSKSYRWPIIRRNRITPTASASPISSGMIHFQVVTSVPSPIIADLFG